MAAMKELKILSGDMVVNGSIAYVSQGSWVFGGTLRQNILFGKDYKKTAYNEVIKACDLQKVKISLISDYLHYFLTFLLFTFSFPILLRLYVSHKKRKDSLEDSLDRVLLAAELELTKILVPRLPQHTSNVKIECAGKSEWSKQLYSLYVTSFLEH